MFIGVNIIIVHCLQISDYRNKAWDYGDLFIYLFALFMPSVDIQVFFVSFCLSSFLLSFLLPCQEENRDLPSEDSRCPGRHLKSGRAEYEAVRSDMLKKCNKRMYVGRFCLEVCEELLKDVRG